MLRAWLRNGKVCACANSLSCIEEKKKIPGDYDALSLVITWKYLSGPYEKESGHPAVGKHQLKIVEWTGSLNGVKAGSLQTDEFGACHWF